MFHMIEERKSGLPLKKRTVSRMSIHPNLCLNRRLHLLESLAGWWVNQKFPKIIKSSSRKYESFLKWPFGLRSGNAGHSRASGDSGGFGSVNRQHSKNRGSKTTAQLRAPTERSFRSLRQSPHRFECSPWSLSRRMSNNDIKTSFKTLMI